MGATTLNSVSLQTSLTHLLWSAVYSGLPGIGALGPRDVTVRRVPEGGFLFLFLIFVPLLGVASGRGKLGALRRRPAAPLKRPFPHLVCQQPITPHVFAQEVLKSAKL